MRSSHSSPSEHAVPSTRFFPRTRGLRRGHRFWGSVLVGLLALYFCSLWFNRYFGVTTDGWFFFFAQQLTRGHMPYRDFHLFGPPLHVLEQALMIKVFGAHMIVPHLFGLLQRVVIAVVLFRWLSTIYKDWVALLASLFCVVLFSTDIADTVFFYHHDSVFWGVLAGYAAHHTLAAGRRAAQRSERLWGLATGVLAGATFVDKQTTGLGVSAVLFVILVVLGARRASGPEGSVAGRAWASAWPYVVGWIVPVGLVFSWLASEDALAPFFDQVFIHASAKGSLAVVVTRPFAGALTRPTLQVAAGAALGVLAIGFVGRRSISRLAPSVLAGRRLFAQWAWPLATAGAVLFVGIALAYPWLEVPRLPRLVAAYVSLFGSMAYNVYFLARLVREPLDARDETRWLLAGVSFGFAYSFSLSWPAWELMVIPGVAFLLAEVLDVRGVEAPKVAWRVAVAALAVGLVIQATHSRLRQPYLWGGWLEPSVRQSTTIPDHPVLAGFELSATTSEFLQTVAGLIASYSEPDEPVFVFPHLPILYVLSERAPSTFCYVHWFDVVNDDLAEADARHLAENPPRVMVDYEVSPGEWAGNEHDYRAGQRSGQRSVVETVHRMGASELYALVARIPAPNTGATVSVWVRRD